MVGAEGNATKGACCMHRLLIGGHRFGGGEHGVIVRVSMVAEEHEDVVRLSRGGVDRVCVAGVRGSSCTGADVAGAEMVLEGGTRNVVVGPGLGG